MTIEYETYRLQEGEHFLVFIDSIEMLRVSIYESNHNKDWRHNKRKEKFNLEAGDHMIQFSVENVIEPDLIASFYDVQLGGLKRH